MNNKTNVIRELTIEQFAELLKSIDRLSKIDKTMITFHKFRLMKTLIRKIDFSNQINLQPVIKHIPNRGFTYVIVEKKDTEDVTSMKTKYIVSNYYFRHFTSVEEVESMKVKDLKCFYEVCGEFQQPSQSIEENITGNMRCS